MKKKIKNIILSLLVAFTLLLGANFPLAFSVVNSIKNFSMAEYKPTDFVTPYEFSSKSGWKSESSNGVSSAFTGSAPFVNISDLTEYKPATTYKGTSTDVESGSDVDFGSMMIKANKAPATVEVEKRDEDKNIVWKKVDGEYVRKTNDQGDVIYSDSNNNDPDRFVLIDDANDPNNGKYYEKVAEMENENTFYYFQTTSSLALKANSWYVIVAHINTFDANASLMVTGTNFEKEVKIDNNPDDTWKKVYLFIETSGDNTNSVNLRFYYGSSDGITSNSKAETGAVYLDGVSVQTISQTEYIMETVGGEEPTTGAIIDKYSVRYDDVRYDGVRYDKTLTKYNANFETVNDLGNGNFQFNLYEEMYGEDSYNADDVRLTENGYYQYYVNKYVDDSGKEKLTDKQLGLIHKAYNEKVSVGINLESKAFETEKPVLDAEGKQEVDGNGDPKTEIVAGPSTFNNENNHILKIENNSEKYSLGLLSAPITIKQFRYYKLTVYVKGVESSDSATVKLISYIKTGQSSVEGAMQVKSQTVDAFTDESDITNNWKAITFYIQGSSYRDTNMQIALLADAESTVYYDNIRLENIASQTYSSATSSLKFDLFPSSTSITSSITNGYFDSIKIENSELYDAYEKQEDLNKIGLIEAPYTPASWTEVDNASKKVVSGIISSQDNLYSTVASKIGNASNPISEYEYNGTIVNPARTNMLVMYAPKDVEDNTKTHNFGYTSNSFSLSSNSVYKISLQVYASNTSGDSNFKGNVYAKLTASDKNIAEFDIELDTASLEKGAWQTYTFIVRTGSVSRSVKIQLGIEDALGTVFFQKVGYKKLAEKTLEDKTKVSVDEQYLELAQANKTIEQQTENKVKLVSYESDAFVMHSENKVENKDYFESLSHSLKTEKNEDKEEVVSPNQGEMGIVDYDYETKFGDGILTLSSNPSDNLASAFLTNPKANSSFVMFIFNGSNYNTVVRPKNEISLSSSSYYEISIYVKTKGIAEGNGLKINMDKISASFNNINTEKNTYGDLTDSNGYKKFTVYVKTGSSTISGLQITYELGSENNKFTGTALLSNLQVKKLADESAYNELIKDVNSSDTTTILKDFSTPSSSESKADEDADNLTLATFFLVFSSILLVGVLVFAIVAVYIKRVPKAHTVTGTNKANVARKKDSDIPKDGFV